LQIQICPSSAWFQIYESLLYLKMHRRVSGRILVLLCSSCLKLCWVSCGSDPGLSSSLRTCI
jgi:hypothetical protein